jgi:hypothetical protein
MTWLSETAVPVMPHFECPPLYSGLLTYPLHDGAISTHQLDILCTQNRVLIVGTDRTYEFYPRQSLTNSVEHFIEAVLKQFPWINTVRWDVIEHSSSGDWNAVSLDEEIDRKGRRIRFCNPKWQPIDITPIQHLLAIPAPVPVFGSSLNRPELATPLITQSTFQGELPHANV